MNEIIYDEPNNYINKTFQAKGVNEKNFFNNIILLYDIIKELEKEWDNKNIYNINDKNKIHLLFSLLYFEISFIQQISQINMNNKTNKIQNNNLIFNTINYNKEILSKKIEQFLFFNNEKCNNNETNNKTNTQKTNTKLKSNSCIKKKSCNNNSNVNIGNNSTNSNIGIGIGSGNALKLNKKTNNEDMENKKKKIQMMNNKNDINNVKINYRYFNDSTLKNNKINKSNNISKKKKKVVNNYNENRNRSNDILKMNKSNKSIDKINNTNINFNSLNIENKYSNIDIKCNKTINNFHKQSFRCKDNFSNNDNSLLYSSVDERDINPIRKVKNIIIKVRNKNNSMDCKTSYHSNNEKNINLEQRENNKEENKINLNDKNSYQLISKSGFLFSFYHEKDKLKKNENIKNNFLHKARETKEILHDCMNQIQKKLSSHDNKYNQENKSIYSNN